jgi:hypothetical protein
LPFHGPKLPIEGSFALASIAPRNVTTEVMAYPHGKTTNVIVANMVMK